MKSFWVFGVVLFSLFVATVLVLDLSDWPIQRVNRQRNFNDKDDRPKYMMEAPSVRMGEKASLNSRENRENQMRKIPMNIFQIRITESKHSELVPRRMHRAIQTILDLNPQWNYKLIKDDDTRSFLVDHFPSHVIKAHDRIIPSTYRTDLLRYCLLQKYGGFYIDSGHVCFTSLSEVVPLDVEFIAPKDFGYGLITGCIGSCVNSVIMQEAIRSVVEHVDTNYFGSNGLDPTGPGCLGKAFQKVMGISQIKPGLFQTPVKSLIWHRYTQNLTREVIYDENNTKHLFNMYYDGYRSDSVWYYAHKKEGNKRYSELWRKRAIYEAET